MYSDILSFIRDTFNTPEGQTIPLHAPTFNGNEKKYLLECIDTGYVSSVGQFVNDFEREFAKFTGAKKAVVCVNGTNAIHLALELVGVQRGDEVLTQALTFVATANAVSYTGAKPVFIDVDKDTFGMSPAALERFLSEKTEQKGGACYNKNTGAKISACVPMHTFGNPLRIDEIAEICKKYNIILVEDSAESAGSFYKGLHTGRYGKVGLFSFNGNKTITTGGGGMFITDDEELGAKIKHITTQAKRPHRWEFAHDAVGYNYRMPNINAALGLAQLEQLPLFLEKKRALAAAYHKFFDSKNISTLKELEGGRSNYWLNAVIFNTPEERDAFLTVSNDSGVMTRPIWRLMTDLPMFKDCEHDGLDNSKWLEARVVNLPSSVIL
ncbi:aminotransferase [Parelusimicrobium proximum]|uniref:LegC family aminotransferase n=1 Tax=Parelusimicrobium proximum TaxID=3228953 RepID=UPI003D16C690